MGGNGAWSFSGYCRCRAIRNQARKFGKASKIDFYVKPNGDAVPGMMYRYSDSSTFETLCKRKENFTSYVSPEKFESSGAAVNGLQIDVINCRNNCGVRSSFDSIQVIDDIRVPYVGGDKMGAIKRTSNKFLS